MYWQYICKKNIVALHPKSYNVINGYYCSMFWNSLYALIISSYTFCLNSHLIRQEKTPKIPFKFPIVHGPKITKNPFEFSIFNGPKINKKSQSNSPWYMGLKNIHTLPQFPFDWLSVQTRQLSFPVEVVLPNTKLLPNFNFPYGTHRVGWN